jgi:hypothetical protein
MIFAKLIVLVSNLIITSNYMDIMFVIRILWVLFGEIKFGKSVGY